MKRTLLFVLTLTFGSQAFSAEAKNVPEIMKRAWGMNTDFGIDSSKGWQITKKLDGNCEKSSVVIAVIDTGFDANHPALQKSLWVNKKEANGKPGVDDDANGFIDDMNGWDFAKNSGALSDPHGHGTHIAGIISGNGEGPEAFKGVCPGAKIMALRYYDEKASGDANLLNTVKAIEYAVANGAKIINYSGGGALFSRPEYTAMKRAQDKGILVVAAAGNEHSNADKNLYFPAAYSLPNILSVAAIDDKGTVLPSSNWGVHKVHVAAPGNGILSTLPNGAYGFMTGTSQATAFVSGIAALVMSENPSFTAARVKATIEDSAIRYAKLNGKTKSGGRASAFAALEKAQNAGKKNFFQIKKLAGGSSSKVEKQILSSD